jgi:hypothetical protein
MAKWHLNISFLEQGDIFFFYKPKKGISEVKGMPDVGRFYLVLSPFEDKPRRFMVLGKKRLPAVYDGGESAWGFIEKVGGRGFKVFKEGLKTTASRRGARPAGEGIYSIVKHFNHTHFVYTLELPKSLGAVQKSFNIKKSASYIFNAKNPLLDDAGQFKPGEGQPGILPQYKKRKFVPTDPTSILDREGQEILLTGSTKNYAHLGISADKEEETEESAEIFTRLEVNPDRHPPHPLFTGEWV